MKRWFQRWLWSQVHAEEMRQMQVSIERFAGMGPGYLEDDPPRMYLKSRREEV